MPAATVQEDLPVYASPASKWIKLSTGSYADPNMLLGADGNPLTKINIYQCHLAAQKLGLRLIDDIEFNSLVNSNPEAAEQMRSYAVFTSLLRDVNSSGDGYTAKHIARPEVSIADGEYVAKGREKPIRLPKSGFFKIKELLESDTGLPTKTYGDKIPDEPSAYFWIAAGDERPVSRGRWYLDGRRQFDARARWESLSSDPDVGARVAREEEPNAVFLASAEALVELEQIRQKHGVSGIALLRAIGDGKYRDALKK